MDSVPCRKCGALTAFVIDAKTRKGILVEAVPQQGYVVVGATKAGDALVELREIWVPHFRVCRRADQ